MAVSAGDESFTAELCDPMPIPLERYNVCRNISVHQLTA